MTNDNDAKLAKLLLAMAPPARDPFFRLRVLERRERQRYQQRCAQVVAAIFFCVVFFAVVAQIRIGLLTATITLAFAIGLLIAMTQILKGISAWRLTAKKI